MGERVLLAFEDGLVQGVSLRQGAIKTPAWVSVLPAQALQRGMPQLKDLLGDFLGDLLLSMGLIGQSVSLALPAAGAHWRVVEWPFEEWPDTPIEALRTLDPDLGLPFALADAALDLQPLPGQPLRSLLVAAPRALVEAWVEVMQLAGMPLERLLPAQVCLRQALLPRLQRLDPRDGVVVLQPGSLTTTVQFWQQSVPIFERLLPADDPQLADQIVALLAFCGKREPGFAPRRVWLTSALPQQQALAEALALPLEQLDWPDYDSPVVQGLAQVR
ncbi:MAG: hypothetical protein FJ077_01970 [Cyanobacteria bacterium K_DeepCast_35m_m2_023]|nr:hypothetical protein [Cyanobacteria bacterium K_DeepCast_35m_m2_023]